MSKLIIPKTTTAYRETAVPKAADLLFDTDIKKMVIGDGVTPGGIVIDVSGGTASSGVTGGFGINVVDNEVSLKRYDSISTLINGGTVQAGYAYKLNATSSSGTTIYAEWFEKGTFARDPAHIQIMVNDVGYLHLGQKTTAGSETAPFVLVGALEPDAMNNVTVRFHDGVAVMTVEDHIGGYVVISGGTSQSTAGTLPYALVNTGSDASPYITFSSELNGTTFDVTGVTVTTERHVVGNGYDETKITGDVNVGTSGTLTMAAVGLQNVIVSSGTLTLGDVYIPFGGTVGATDSGYVNVEKAIVDGTLEWRRPNLTYLQNVRIDGSGIIDLSDQYLDFPFSTGSNFIGGVTIRNGNNYALSIRGGATLTLSGTTIGNNGSALAGTVRMPNGHLIVSDCTFDVNQTLNISGASSFVDMYGSNHTKANIGGAGTLKINSGAVIDLTGNSNPTPIAPGGGITFESGGATVKVGDSTASSSYMMDNVTLPAGAKLTNTALVNLGGSGFITIPDDATVRISGAYITSGSGYVGGITAKNGVTATLENCAVVDNVGQYSDSKDVRFGPSCTVNLSGTTTGGFFMDSGSTLNIAGYCYADRYKSANATINISSGATINISGTSSIDPVITGAITFGANVTIINSAGQSVLLNNGSAGTCNGVNKDGSLVE